MSRFIDKKTGEIYPETPTGKRSKAKSKKSKLTLDEIQEKFSRKSAAYWAQMRTNLKLAHRSEYVSEATIDAIRSELSDILDSGILSYPQTLEEVGISPGMKLEEKKVQLGIDPKKYVHSEDEKKFLKAMENMAEVSRKSNWSWRIGEEAEEKQRNKWHPFFVTLTVDPQKCDGVERILRSGRKLQPYESPEELWKKGREFRRYIRDLATMVAREVGDNPPHKPPYKPEYDYVTYAGVIEHGKSREHHHGHFIIWLRAIPSGWKLCPNRGIRDKSKRTKNECLPLRTYWPWSLPGLSPALYFRSVSDVWSTEYRFALPLDERTGEPMRVSTPRVAGNYITKYLSKEHKQWHHRMKATRNLGKKKLRQILRETDSSVVKALTWRALSSKLNLLLMQIHTVPLGLLRSEAKQQDYLNQFKHKNLDLTELLTSNYDVFTRMLTSVQNGARPDRMDSLEFYDWLAGLLHGQKGYCEVKQICAHTYIGQEYPPIKKVTQHVKLGGNEIGYT